MHEPVPVIRSIDCEGRVGLQDRKRKFSSVGIKDEWIHQMTFEYSLPKTNQAVCLSLEV